MRVGLRMPEPPRVTLQEEWRERTIPERRFPGGYGIARSATDRPAIRIVDIRGEIRPVEAPKPWYLESREEYAGDHIPGAVFVGWLTDIVDPDAPVKMTVAPPRRFAELMGGLGIGDAHMVVAYDDDGNHLAARLWWLLNYYGHSAVRLLDGGYPKWLAEGRLDRRDPRYPGSFTPGCGPSGGGARTFGAPSGIPGCGSIAAGRAFRGEVGRGERGTDSRSGECPIKSWDGPYKTWKSEADLRGVHEAAAVTPDRRVITYCNAGVSAAVGLLLAPGIPIGSELRRLLVRLGAGRQQSDRGRLIPLPSPLGEELLPREGDPGPESGIVSRRCNRGHTP
jgi:thiosulfate/3-mercaptopyruvate sulfurtransferase